jgi:hypothetical protein
VQVVEGLADKNHEDGDAELEAQVRARVGELCRNFPIY